MKRTTSYLTLSIAMIALALIVWTPGASSKATARTIGTSVTGSTKVSTDDEAPYWYFVVSYSDTDKRVTNTFYSSGAALRVYYKVRVALGGFQGDLEGTSFATRQEAEEARAANWPNAQVVSISDPLD
jgi:hypothetical protein